jgi:RiboL-PSP-HEPN
MPSHTAKSLFDLNIQSSTDLLKVYDGIEKLGTNLQISWLLRAVVVFSVSALDAYFHDKVKYRAGKFDLQDMPPALAKFEIPLGGLTKWEEAKRKGNVIRNWLTDHFSTIPLQRKDDIANALKMVGVDSVWATIEPDSPKRDAMLEEMREFIRRRNQIAHEGDRQSSRKSGKKLRGINRAFAQNTVDFSKELVRRIENAFPN